ncbi:MAG TPA: hypothetical protein VK872_04960, partial [Draconibacterium sp.]|nr:hypothetical protein [Draconibacterium sp.]
LLIAACTNQEKEQVKRLIAVYEHLRQLLNMMPLFVFNPLLNALNLVMRSDGKPMLFSWTQWSLEPIGVGLPRKANQAYLEKILKQASEKRPDLLEVTPEMVLITGYASRLDIAITMQNFRQGLQLVPNLLDHLEQCKLSSKQPGTFDWKKEDVPELDFPGNPSARMQV